MRNCSASYALKSQATFDPDEFDNVTHLESLVTDTSTSQPSTPPLPHTTTTHHHLGHRATKVMGTRQANQPSYPHRKPLLLIYCLASIERTREKQRDRRRFMTSTSLQYSTDIHQPPIWSMATSNWIPSPPLLPCYRWRTFYLLLGIATTSGQWRWREAER